MKTRNPNKRLDANQTLPPFMRPLEEQNNHMEPKDLLPEHAKHAPFPTRRLVAVVPPPCPLWAVYWHDDATGTEGKIFLDPVLLLSVYEERCPDSHDEPDSTGADIFPVLLIGRELVEEDGETSNYLGLTDNPKTRADMWKAEIARCSKRAVVLNA